MNQRLCRIKIVWRSIYFDYLIINQVGDVNNAVYPVHFATVGLEFAF
jgi:hypothetical protein